MSDDEYSKRYQAQLRKEFEEADQDWVRKQKLLDHLWQAKLDSEAPLDDGFDYSTGFKVPPYQTSCVVMSANTIQILVSISRGRHCERI